jgi:hypothetical protein
MTIAATMDLLDRFAIAALPQVIADWRRNAPDIVDVDVCIAAQTYGIAAAMLRQHHLVAEQVRAEAMRPAAPTT